MSRLRRIAAIAAVIGLTCNAILRADDRNAEVERVVRGFAATDEIALPIGVTSAGTFIWAVTQPQALLPRRGLRRVVIVAGVDGDPSTVAGLQQHRSSAVFGPDVGSDYARVWIPIANPDAWYESLHMERPLRPLTFPPRGSAYNTPGEVEAAVVSRFLEWFAPDAIVEVTSANDPDWSTALESGEVAWKTDRLAGSSKGLDAAGRVQLSAARVPVDLLDNDPQAWNDLERAYTRIAIIAPDQCSPSATASAAIARLERRPEDVVAHLLKHYGDRLSTVMYQPALAVIARLEFGQRSGDAAQRALVSQILEPYLSADRPTLDEKSNGSQFAGHLVFAAWAQATGDERAVALVRLAADRAFDADGKPLAAMPTHSEMSDAVFMACPILVAAGRLTGEVKYLDMAGRHLTFMQELCLREDGLYRHSPLCETPWGRGNGFPALGLALCLSDLDLLLDDTSLVPGSSLQQSARRLREQMLTAYRSHMQALLGHQDPTGAWRQVIDHPAAYRELTATCMVTFAMARGLREGWLDKATFRPAVDRAWEAINLRVYDDGVLIDVCTGTGKQKSLRDYLDRTAILDRDERGGAMALLAALEMTRLRAGE